MPQFMGQGAHVDDLSVTINQDASKKPFAVLSSLSLECQKDWVVSPRLKEKTDTPFTMSEGFV